MTVWRAGWIRSWTGVLYCHSIAACHEVHEVLRITRWTDPAEMDNATGTDKNAPKRDITNEVLLPALAKLHAGSDAIADEATLQRASDLVAPDQVCPAGNTFCTSAVSTIDGRTTPFTPRSGHKSPHHSAGCCPASAGKRSPVLDQQEATS